MASRSVNSLRFSKDDMRRVYRDHARRQRGGVKIGHIIETLDILVPVIPHFFGQSRIGADAHRYNRSSMGYAGEDDRMSYQSSGRCGLGMASGDAIGSGRYDFGMANSSDAIHSDRYGHGMSYDNFRGNDHYEIAHVDHYGDRIISEEEFERLLDYAEERNVKMY